MPFPITFDSYAYKYDKFNTSIVSLLNKCFLSHTKFNKKNANKRLLSKDWMDIAF